MAQAKPTTVKEYAKLVIRSRLLGPSDMQLWLDRWQSATQGKMEEIESLRKYLVENQILTEYQSLLINRGHSEGFFLNDYQIIDLIAKGRMAGVYKARHQLGQIVAIKVLPSSKSKDASTLARFQREGEILTKLDHPNVVRAFEVNSSKGRYFMVMEYLEGDTLEEVLRRRKKLTSMETCHIMQQILSGLNHMHSFQLVHRDLKPANIILLKVNDLESSDSVFDTTVKILDVGLGRNVFGENATPGKNDLQLTTVGDILGTPDYLAPEQASNASTVDIRADLYSIGCIFFHCLTGELLFPDTNLMNQIFRHISEPPRPLSQFFTTVPPGLQEIMNKLLAKNPEERFQNPQEALDAFTKQIESQAKEFRPQSSIVIPAYEAWLHEESNGHKFDTETRDYPAALQNPAGKGTDLYPAYIDPIAGEVPNNPLISPAPASDNRLPAHIVPAKQIMPSPPSPLSKPSRPLPNYSNQSKKIPVNNSPSLPPTSESPSFVPIQTFEAREKSRQSNNSPLITQEVQALDPDQLIRSEDELPPKEIEEFDAEVVVVPQTNNLANNTLLSPDPFHSQEPPRSIFSLSLRDYVMLAIGATFMFLAITGGYFIAQALRKNIHKDLQESVPDPSPKNSIPKETAPKETAPKETTPKETAPKKEDAAKEDLSKEKMKIDSDKKEPKPKSTDPESDPKENNSDKKSSPKSTNGEDPKKKEMSDPKDKMQMDPKQKLNDKTKEIPKEKEVDKKKEMMENKMEMKMEKKGDSPSDKKTEPPKSKTPVKPDLAK